MFVSVIVAAIHVVAGVSLAAEREVFDYDGQKSAPAGTKRIAFIASHESYGGIGSHEFFAGSLYLARRINAVYPNAWAVVYTDDQWPKMAPDVNGIVVMINGGGGRAADDPLIKAACDKGAGYMAVHWATEVDKGRQGASYDAWIGGHCESYWSVNPFWKPQMTIGRHPVANGVKPFAIVDEWLYHLRFVDGMAGITPVLSAVAPLETVHYQEGGQPSDLGGNADVLRSVQNKEPQVIAWAYDRKDGGRGFGFTGFHIYNNLANDNFRTILLNGVAWISKLQIPETGVPSTTPTKEELAELLQEAHPHQPAGR